MVICCVTVEYCSGARKSSSALRARHVSNKSRTPPVTPLPPIQCCEKDHKYSSRCPEIHFAKTLDPFLEESLIISLPSRLWLMYLRGRIGEASKGNHIEGDMSSAGYRRRGVS